jgi:uncharacterized membrane protein YukC
MSAQEPNKTQKSLPNQSEKDNQSFEFDPKVLKALQRYSGVILVIIMLIMLSLIIYYMTKYDQYEQSIISNPCFACEQYNQKVCIDLKPNNPNNIVSNFNNLPGVNDSNRGTK